MGPRGDVPRGVGSAVGCRGEHRAAGASLCSVVAGAEAGRCTLSIENSAAWRHFRPLRATDLRLCVVLDGVMGLPGPFFTVAGEPSAAFAQLGEIWKSIKY